jgi:hypothetical protein
LPREIGGNKTDFVSLRVKGPRFFLQKSRKQSSNNPSTQTIINDEQQSSTVLNNPSNQSTHITNNLHQQKSRQRHQPSMKGDTQVTNIINHQ